MGIKFERTFVLISTLHDLNEVVKWCDVCRGHEDGKCDECHNKFSPGEHTYHSQTFHYHPASIGGTAGVRSVQKELCIDCYRADFAKAYPDIEVPDLPNKGVDANFHAAQRTERRRELLDKIIHSIANREVVSADQIHELQEIIKVGLRFC